MTGGRGDNNMGRGRGENDWRKRREHRGRRKRRVEGEQEGRRRRRNEEVIMTLDAFITQQRWRGRKVWRWSPLSS